MVGICVSPFLWLIWSQIVTAGAGGEQYLAQNKRPPKRPFEFVTFMMLLIYLSFGPAVSISITSVMISPFLLPVKSESAPAAILMVYALS